MKINKFQTLFFLCLAILSCKNTMQGQCSTANAQQFQGGAILCNFPFLSQEDVNHYTNRLKATDAAKWYTDKTDSAKRSSQQWKTTNLRVLLMTNHDDIIDEVQIEKLKLAMNLHLVEIANADKTDQLEWSHMPVVEDIIIRQYDQDLSNLFDVMGYTVFSDPDQRNGETQLNKLVREVAIENNINTVINLMDAPLDIPFLGSAQIYCNDPGEFMTISIKKNNTISLSDKYLVQFAMACVHSLGHTNFANHQETSGKNEASLLCHDHNHAQTKEYESVMMNGLKDQKMRTKKSKPFGATWSITNAEQIIDTYIQRGLLLPLFEYNSEGSDTNVEEKIENTISLFPNPVEDMLTIEVTNDAQYDLSIYNVNGKLINKKTLDSFITELDVSNYDSGIYIFEFSCPNSSERFTKKVEKIK